MLFINVGNEQKSQELQYKIMLTFVIFLQHLRSNDLSNT